MAKFNFKKVGKDAGKYAIDLGAVTVGALATAKFLDFNTLFPQMNPNGFFIRHQGAVKAGAAFIVLTMFGNRLPGWAKMLVLGVGLEGAIKEVRVLTTGATGESMFPQLGQADSASDAQLEAAAREITEQYRPGVAGMGQDPYDQAQWNRESAVAGIGQDGPTIYREAV
jgi:hypothetical protein